MTTLFNLMPQSWYQSQPRPQGPLSTSRKHPGCSWSRVYACKPKPYRGWVLDLILSTLSREVNVALPYRRYFVSLPELLRDVDRDGSLLVFHCFFNNRRQPVSNQFYQFDQFFTLKELNNREIIDGMQSTRSYFLHRKLELPPNRFKTKAAGFCKRSS